MNHRTTDPACSRFAGYGKVHRILGLRVRSWRRIRFDRGRGRSCEACQHGRTLADHYFGGGIPLR